MSVIIDHCKNGNKAEVIACLAAKKSSCNDKDEVSDELSNVWNKFIWIISCMEYFCIEIIIYLTLL